jgi:ketosteroid isomerase-like protein
VTDDLEALQDLEWRRCAAIGAGDLAALNEILADDYLHVLGTASTNDKAQYFATITEGPRAPERGPLTIRQYGDGAVITGEIINRITYPGQETRVIHAMVTQVAIKHDGRWRFVGFQITPKRLKS